MEVCSFVNLATESSQSLPGGMPISRALAVLLVVILRFLSKNYEWGDTLFFMFFIAAIAYLAILVIIN